MRSKLRTFEIDLKLWPTRRGTPRIQALEKPFLDAMFGSGKSQEGVISRRLKLNLGQALRKCRSGPATDLHEM